MVSADRSECLLCSCWRGGSGQAVVDRHGQSTAAGGGLSDEDIDALCVEASQLGVQAAGVCFGVSGAQDGDLASHCALSAGLFVGP